MLLLLLIITILMLSCGGGSGGRSNTEAEGLRTMLIPLYSYPEDSRYRSEYERLYNLNTGKEIWVIINPDIGPGNYKDVNFERAINRLRGKGYKVIGYIGTHYAGKSTQRVKSEIDAYMNFYPQIDGFFFDEVIDNRLSYYTELYLYAREKGKLVVINPGAKVPREYYQISDIVVPFESNPDFLMNNYTIENPTQKDCFLVYGVDSQRAQSVLDYLLSRQVKCAYIYHETNPSWLILSPYMDLMLER